MEGVRSTGLHQTTTEHDEERIIVNAHRDHGVRSGIIVIQYIEPTRRHC